MNAKRTFINTQAAVEEARTRRLTGSELRMAIKVAEELGKKKAAAELKLYVVKLTTFAGDAAPLQVKERVA